MLKETEIRILKNKPGYSIEYKNHYGEIWYQSENVDIYTLDKATRFTTYECAEQYILDSYSDVRCWGLHHGTTLREGKILEVYRIKDD